MAPETRQSYFHVKHLSGINNNDAAAGMSPFLIRLHASLPVPENFFRPCDSSSELE